MTTAWNAYFYEGLDNAHPPRRTEVIEAKDETEAAKIARSHMGRAHRVDLVPPRWESSEIRVILASDDPVGAAASAKPD